MMSSIVFSFCCFILYLQSPYVQAGKKFKTGPTHNEIKGNKPVLDKIVLKIFKDNDIENAISKGQLLTEASLLEYPTVILKNTIIAIVDESKKGVTALHALLSRCDRTKELGRIIHVAKNTDSQTTDTQQSSQTEEQKEVQQDLDFMFNRLLLAARSCVQYQIFKITSECQPEIVQDAINFALDRNESDVYFQLDGIGSNPEVDQQKIEVTKLYALEIRNLLKSKHNIPDLAVEGSSFFGMKDFVGSDGTIEQAKYSQKATTVVSLNGFIGNKTEMERMCDKLILAIDSRVQEAIQDSPTEAMEHERIVLKFEKSIAEKKNITFDKTIFTDSASLAKAASCFTVISDTN